MTGLSEVREKLERITMAHENIRGDECRSIALESVYDLAREASALLESEQGEWPVEGGISEDDADMLFNEMSWEVKFDPRAVTDKRAGFLHATLIIKPRAILDTESENGADGG